MALAVATITAVSRPDGGGSDGDRASRPAALVRTGSLPVEVAEPLTIGEEPTSYRIVYRLQERQAPPATETVTVVRPYDSRAETRHDPDGPVVAVRQAALGRYAMGRQAADPDTVLAVTPAVAEADVRLAPILPDLLERRLVRPLEHRRVAGRTCRIYRASTTVLGGTLTALDAQAEVEPPEYADLCLDDAGLLLEEWWVVEGRAIRHRLATRVEAPAPAPAVDELADLTLSRPTTVPVDKGGGSVLRMTPDSAPPGRFFTPAYLPDGFEHAGRFSVVPPQPEALSDPSRREELLAATTDVWRRGIDILVIDQGGTLGQQRAFEPSDDAVATYLGPLGTGELVFGATGVEARVALDAGDYVRVYGTVPASTVLAVARALVATEGRAIVLLDD
ncbi:MAG: hypothetical protein KY443_02955 [Actinobacteria bacterium]|nr:hypothetical protein [Actinomycetota bacterium]